MRNVVIAIIATTLIILLRTLITGPVAFTDIAGEVFVSFLVGLVVAAVISFFHLSEDSDGEMKITQDEQVDAINKGMIVFSLLLIAMLGYPMIATVGNAWQSNQTTELLTGMFSTTTLYSAMKTVIVTAVGMIALWITMMFMIPAIDRKFGELKESATKEKPKEPDPTPGSPDEKKKKKKEEESSSIMKWAIGLALLLVLMGMLQTGDGSGNKKPDTGNNQNQNQNQNGNNIPKVTIDPETQEKMQANTTTDPAGSGCFGCP